MTVPPPSSLPFSEESDPGYAHHVVSNFELKPYGRGSLLAVGTCPRCTAKLEIPVVLATVRSLFRRGTARSGPVEVPMACNCDEDHPGRPYDTEGCGAFWLLGVPEDLA